MVRELRSILHTGSVVYNLHRHQLACAIAVQTGSAFVQQQQLQTHLEPECFHLGTNVRALLL